MQNYQSRIKKHWRKEREKKLYDKCANFNSREKKLYDKYTNFNSGVLQFGGYP